MKVFWACPSRSGPKDRTREIVSLGWPGMAPEELLAVQPVLATQWLSCLWSWKRSTDWWWSIWKTWLPPFFPRWTPYCLPLSLNYILHHLDPILSVPLCWAQSTIWGLPPPWWTGGVAEARIVHLHSTDPQHWRSPGLCPAPTALHTLHKRLHLQAPRRATLPVTRPSMAGSRVETSLYVGRSWSSRSFGEAIKTWSWRQWQPSSMLLLTINTSPVAMEAHKQSLNTALQISIFFWYGQPDN